jgi:hypothetical protein
VCWVGEHGKKPAGSGVCGLLWENQWVNWKYAITIFKDWRSAIKNRLIGNLPLQFNHMPKLVIAIQSDIGNLPLQFGAILEICHSISASA